MTRASWRPLPYEPWRTTCDTLHAHTQVLGKLSARLAPPEPQLQHAALRLTPRGWETMPLPAPDGSGAFAVCINLCTHHTVIEHVDGRQRSIALRPDRAVGEVTVEVLGAVEELVGPVPFDPAPQETPWSNPLDTDTEHATYDVEHVAAYLAAANQAAGVLAALRAPYRGRSTPVNAWWGSFDLAVGLFSGRAVTPDTTDFIGRNSMDAQEVSVGWWPGDARYPRAAFYAYAYPAPLGYGTSRPGSGSGRWEQSLGEYVLDWDDVVASDDPHGMALDFARSVVTHSCAACEWDHDLAASVELRPPPVR